ncbi:MAG: polyhydroxybutyrate depolymerase [Chloroflexi bacterium]|nr:polyhydroxybutyrate depolymerase [Chloroflexota bacterium]
MAAVAWAACRLVFGLLLATLLTGCAAGGSGARDRRAPTPSATPSPALGPGDHAISIRAGGLDRRYLVHVPPGYDAKRPVPVVVMLHGGGGTAAGVMRETGWAAKADAAGFLAVFPEATSFDPQAPSRFLGNPQLWNDGSGRGHAGRRNTDDVGFISSLLDDLSARFAVDKRRVFVAGHSNGASMAFRVAAELAGRVAAVAPVSGHLWLADPKPSRPVPLLYIIGTEDPLNPLDGGDVRLPWGGGIVEKHPPILDSVLRWAGLNGCPTEPRVVLDKNGVKGVAYSPCQQGAEVLYYTVEGQGHGWPGGTSLLPERWIGRATDKLDATDLIWDFFTQRSLAP